MHWAACNGRKCGAGLLHRAQLTGGGTKNGLVTRAACAQIAMGTFVSYFFSGFILGKIPFPLSPSFRLMLQVSRSLHAQPWHLPVACMTPHLCSSFCICLPGDLKLGLACINAL